MSSFGHLLLLSVGLALLGVAMRHVLRSAAQARRDGRSSVRAAGEQARQDIAEHLREAGSAGGVEPPLVRVVLDPRSRRRAEREMRHALEVLGLGVIDRVEYHPESASVTVENRNGKVRLLCAFSTHLPAAAELAFRCIEGPVACRVADVRASRLTLLADGIQLKVFPLPVHPADPSR